MSELRSILLLLFLFPAISLGQTIHLDKEKIAYKGEITMQGHGKQSMRKEARSILLNYVNGTPDSLKEEKDGEELACTGIITLPSPYHLRKTIICKVVLHPGEDQISYEIGDIKLKLQERGRTPKVIPSELLLKRMEENGKVAMESEKQLNEIDMYIQKLIALMTAGLSRNSPE